MASFHVLTNHSQEHSLSYSARVSKFECNTTSDWLNQMVFQSQVAAEYTNIWCSRPRTFLKMVGEYGP